MAADYAIATAIPRVGEMIPYLSLRPRDSAGNPVALEEMIVYRCGRELKVWQAVMEHAAGQPADAAGNPRMACIYSGPAGRLAEAQGTPLWVWPAAVLTVPAVLLSALIRLRRRRNASKPGPLKDFPPGGPFIF